jgi:cytoskeletal protein CcmA (bactofilin family)
MTPSSPDTTVVDRHASVSGKMSGHDLLLSGSLDGELTLTGRLHAAAGSKLRARVQADVVEIEGEFEGEVRAGRLRVGASARARGVFIAERLAIEEGAVLEGDVQAPARPAPAGTAPEASATAVAPALALVPPAGGATHTETTAASAPEPAEPMLDERTAAVAATPA